MIIQRLRNQITPSQASPKQFVQGIDLDMGEDTVAGQRVNPENAKNIATAYRCHNIICNDFAKLPEQVYINRGNGQIERQKPDSRLQNTAWLLEKKPNRWMTPFKFKRIRMAWLLNYGASYLWQPLPRPGRSRELFILPSDRTYPYFDQYGRLFYQTTFMSGQTAFLPQVEVITQLINSLDGLSGRGVIQYARETLGRQLGANVTRSKLYKHGFNPAGIAWMSGDLNGEARKKFRTEFTKEMGGSENAYALAILDNKVIKFDQIQMRPMDAAFLASIDQDDQAIANFYDMPQYKLNQGKQAYSSNEQQALEYLSSCLDPYLVQTEEVDADGLLSEIEQESMYVRFNRDAILRTDAKTRAEVHQIRINAGMETPNEGREIEDQSSYEGGDSHYFPGNMGKIMPDGSILGGAAASTNNGGK